MNLFSQNKKPLDPRRAGDRAKLTAMIEDTIAQSRALLSAEGIKTATAAEMDENLLERALKVVSEANDLLMAQRKKIQALESIVAHDEMTGLLNRRGLEQQLAQELGRVRREQSRGCGMAIFDLDGFKAINDNYGHPAGDAAIRHIGDFFNKAVRDTDAMARLGGDEFALVLTNITPEQAQMRANALSAQLNSLTLKWESNVIPLRGSVGLACSVPDDKFERLYRAADEALYRAKLHRK